MLLYVNMSEESITSFVFITKFHTRLAQLRMLIVIVMLLKFGLWYCAQVGNSLGLSWIFYLLDIEHINVPFLSE